VGEEEVSKPPQSNGELARKPSLKKLDLEAVQASRYQGYRSKYQIHKETMNMVSDQMQQRSSAVPNIEELRNETA
jgi:hypothetical protein